MKDTKGFKMFNAIQRTRSQYVWPAFLFSSKTKFVALIMCDSGNGT